MNCNINYFNIRLPITFKIYIDSYFEKYLDTKNSRYTYYELLKDIVGLLSSNGICYANTMMDYIKSHYEDRIDFDKLIIDLMNFRDQEDTPSELKLVHTRIIHVCPPTIVKSHADQRFIHDLESKIKYFDRISFIYQKLIDDAFRDHLMYKINHSLPFEWYTQIFQESANTKIEDLKNESDN